MEVWWTGSSVSLPIMLGAMATTMLVAFTLNLTAGFRKNRAITPFKALGDTPTRGKLVIRVASYQDP